MSQSVEDAMTDQPDHNDEPEDDTADWPIAHLGRGRDDSDDSDDDTDDDTDDEEPSRPAHLRAIVIAALAVVVVGLVAGILVFNSSAPELGRGARTAADAAAQYVHAIDAGDAKAAVAISCSDFVDDAQSQSRTGSDQGISFRIGKVQMVSKSDAVVVVTETLTLPGGHQHSQPETLVLSRSGGRWLVCGRSG